MLTADARARASAWAFASRARAWTLAYSGMAIAARIPMMATTIINSMSVKPCWLPSSLCRRCKNFVMDSASVAASEMLIPRPAPEEGLLGALAQMCSALLVHIVCHARVRRRWRQSDSLGADGGGCDRREAVQRWSADANIQEKNEDHAGRVRLARVIGQQLRCWFQTLRDRNRRGVTGVGDGEG